MKSISQEVDSDATIRLWQDRPIVRTIRIIPLLGLPMKLKTLLSALLLLSYPAIAQAADITGVPKIREGDHLQIGNNRIRLGGIDAPAADQLCLNTKSERWACGAAARDEVTKRFGGKELDLPSQGVTDRRGRMVARCEADGEDIQKWLVSNGWALALTRVSRDYEADEKAAREAKAGMWQGAFIAPWDWRIRNKKTAILGAVTPPENARAILLASASGFARALARLHHQGQRQPRRRVHLSHAFEPLVCEDRDEDIKRHALVLLGRGCRSRRLPRDAAVVSVFVLASLAGRGCRALARRLGA